MSEIHSVICSKQYADQATLGLPRFLTSIVGGSRVDFHGPTVRSRLRPPSGASPSELTSTGADNGWKLTPNEVERPREWYGWKVRKCIF